MHKKRAELREALRNDTVTVTGLTRPRVGDHPGPVEQDYTHKKYSSASLPKMDLKSPARVMEEKSCESSRSSRSATPPVSASALMASTAVAAGQTVTSVESPRDDSLVNKMPSHLRRRSGTPASIRSRVRFSFVLFSCF